MTKPGTRVIAFRNTDETTAYVYGYGTYVGKELRPGWQETLVNPADRAMAERVIARNDADPFDPSDWYRGRVAAGEMTQEECDTVLARAAEHQRAEQAKPLAQRVDELLMSLARNPKIVLDDGAGVVWGCECWWGPADDPRAQRILAGHDVVTVPAPHPADPQEDSP